MTRRQVLPLGRKFLERLEVARGVAYPLFRGMHPRTAFSGSPTEFDGYRPYVTGDDIRWIDWNLFARLEEYFVKVYQVEEEITVLIFVDTSLSMTADGARKHQVASAAAAALSCLAMLTLHHVTIVRYANATIDTGGPYRHLERFAAVTAYLLNTPAVGRGTDLRASLLPHLTRGGRPVTVVVLSDGFQEEPIDRIAASLDGVSGSRMVFMRIRDSRDDRPRLRGHTVAVDAESDDSRSLLVSGEFEKRLHLSIAAYFTRLRASLAGMGAGYFELPVEGSFERNFFNVLVRASTDGAREGAW